MTDHLANIEALATAAHSMAEILKEELLQMNRELDAMLKQQEEQE